MAKKKTSVPESPPAKPRFIPEPGMIVKPLVGQLVISTEQLYQIVETTYDPDKPSETIHILLQTANVHDNGRMVEKLFEWKDDHFKVIAMVPYDEYRG